ncbi:MAG: small multi-drug export protein [Lachnospiraceae bacterium]|jgi:uncharacterized membrane protein|nr:small multi-drug export protein [Lachnospiraceae bacterium]
MVNNLIEQIVAALRENVSKELIIVLISMLPIIELRGALLVAGPLLNIPMLKAAPLCILGNLIPIPFILWLITPIFKWLKEKTKLKNLVEKLEARAMKRSGQIEKYEFWGLVIFVGIPLPGTGGWTGALIASMLGIPFKKAFPAIILGVLIAAVIMCVISYGLLGLF